MERIKKLIRVVLSYPSRFFNRISFRATVVDCEVDKTSVVEHHANVRYSKIGRYTYVSARSSVIFADSEADTYNGGRFYAEANASRSVCVAKYVDTIKEVISHGRNI